MRRRNFYRSAFHFSSTLLRYGFPQSTLRHSEFSYSLIMQGLGNLLNMVCYAGIAAVLVMIALSKEKQRIKTFFVILSGLAAIIALCGIIEFITSMFRSFRYYFSFDTFFWILSSLLLTLTIMAAVVGITYTLLHLSGSTPDLSNITGVIGGSARSSQTSETAQGNTNKKPTIKTPEQII